MIIVHDFPPMFERIAEAFPEAKQHGVMFAWNPRVFIPSGGQITPELRDHERVHFLQQESVGGPENWWKLYIEDAEFRLNQEIPAHRAEYTAFKRSIIDRNVRAKILHAIASRLASPLYGGLISIAEAKKAIS